MRSLLLLLLLVAVRASIDCSPHCYSGAASLTYAEGQPTDLCEDIANCALTFSFVVDPCEQLIISSDLRVGGQRLGDDDTNVLFTCVDVGEDVVLAIVSDSESVSLSWTYAGAECATFLGALSTPSGSFSASETVYLTNWVSELQSIDDYETVCSTPSPTPSQEPVVIDVSTSASTSASTTGDSGQGEDEDDDVVVPLVETSVVLVQAARHIQPTVACSMRLPGRNCCSVFGYVNYNNVSVTIAAEKHNNWMNPKPMDRGQTTEFAGGGVKEAFGVFWPCREYRQQLLRWTVRVARINHTDTIWVRSATAARARHDCNDEQATEWCGVPDDDDEL